MMFVLRMAVRETRASWRRLLFFFICIAVGVAAIVALRSVIQSVRDVFAQRGAGADRRRRAHLDQPRVDAGGAARSIERRLQDAGATERTETVETPTMVRPADAARIASRMVELRAVGPAFPLYGTIGARSRAPPTRTRCCRTGACSSGRSC